MSKRITFGQVREIPKDAEEKRSIPFVLSTPTRDRHHTVLNQPNWQLDNYRKNPIVGYMHNLYGDMCNPPDPDDVIAKSSDIAVIELAGLSTLTANPVFETADLNLKADKIFRKLMLGTLMLHRSVFWKSVQANGALMKKLKDTTMRRIIFRVRNFLNGLSSTSHQIPTG